MLETRRVQVAECKPFYVYFAAVFGSQGVSFASLEFITASASPYQIGRYFTHITRSYARDTNKITNFMHTASR